MMMPVVQKDIERRVMIVDFPVMATILDAKTDKKLDLYKVQVSQTIDNGIVKNRAIKPYSRKATKDCGSDLVRYPTGAGWESLKMEIIQYLEDNY